MKNPTRTLLCATLGCMACTATDIHAAQWAKAFGTEANEAGTLIPGSNGNYQVFALRETASNGTDHVFASLSANGTVTSAKQIGGSKDDSLAVLPLASAYVVMGSTKSYPAPGGARENLVWARFDANWNKVHAKVFGGSATDETGAFIRVSDGGLLFTGSRISYSGSEQTDSDILLLNTRTDGSLKWKKLLHFGPSDSATQGIEITDGYVVSGSLESPADGSGGLLVMKLAKSTGNVLWKKRLRAGSTGERFIPGSLTKVTGGFVVTALVQPENLLLGGPRSIVAKLNGSGAVVWSRSYSASGSGVSAFNVSENTADGTLLLSGVLTGSDPRSPAFGSTAAFAMRLNGSTGAISLQKRFGSDGEYSVATVIRSGGATYLTGTYALSAREFSANPKVLVAQLDASTLAPTWARTFGGPSPNSKEFGGATKIGSGYLLTGSTYSFGASTDTTSDVFGITLDASGNYPGCFLQTLSLATSSPGVSGSDITLASSNPSFTTRSLGNPTDVTLKVSNTTLPATDICSPIGG